MARIRRCPSPDPFAAAPVVMRSRSLRALTRFPREFHTYATRVTLKTFSDGRTTIGVDYADGAHGYDVFQDWRVARDWVVQRTKRNPYFRDALWQHRRIIPTERDGIREIPFDPIHDNPGET